MPFCFIVSFYSYIMVINNNVEAAAIISQKSPTELHLKLSILHFVSVSSVCSSPVSSLPNLQKKKRH